MDGNEKLIWLPEHELVEWKLFETIALSNTGTLDSGEKEIVELLADTTISSQIQTKC